MGGDLAVGPQPCFAAPPPRTFSCARWTTAEKVLLADPRQDAANGGIGSTERLLCSKDRSRSYFYDQTKAPCDCRCCQLLPSTPKTDCLNGVGQIGIYPSNQANNFFAVPMEDIALSDITKALVDGPVALPAALASTSFLGTVLFSSSASQRTILGGLSIPKGTAFSGPIAILGTKGTGVVSMDPTKGFVVDAAPGPLSIADILVLSKNGSTPNLGPMIRIDARGTKANAPAITGSGFMTLLSSGGKAPATMTISGSGLLTVSANIPLWGFGSAVNVSSRLGGKWDDMPVGVSIKFSRADFTVKFANLVVAQLKSYAKRRSDQLAFAQSAVKTRAAQVKSALVKTCDPKTCEAPVTKIDCTQWVRRPLCPATRSCANYDVACWACGLDCFFGF